MVDQGVEERRQAGLEHEPLQLAQKASRPPSASLPSSFLFFSSSSVFLAEEGAFPWKAGTVGALRLARAHFAVASLARLEAARPTAPPMEPKDGRENW